MRIARIELDQIGPFDAASIDIPAPAAGQRGELVIFEGPSGSGKSAILQAIACAAQRPLPEGGAIADLWPLWTAEPARRDPASDGFALMPPLHGVLQRLRAPTARARVTIEADRERFVSTLGPSGLTWPEGAASTSAAARIEASAAAAEGRPTKLGWAAFAYQAHLPTPVVATPGPAEILAPALRGALSFGAFAPAGGHLGQLLTNTELAIEKATVEARQPGAEAKARLAAARRRALDRIEDALSQAVGRAIHFEFPFGQRAPKALVDGEEIPLDRLGEGMRSTLAWLADVLVRLDRAPWSAEESSPLEQDFWLILDEIDEGLHPTLATRILPVVRRLFPNARLYVATHSPFLVASAGAGTIFSLRPNSRGRVAAAVPPRPLEPGQSLEWVVEEIFGAQTGFLDPTTRAAIAAHRLDINRLRRKETLSGRGWEALLERRAQLMALNEEVQSVVAMQEVPVRALIEARLAVSKPPEGEGA